MLRKLGITFVVLLLGSLVGSSFAQSGDWQLVLYSVNDNQFQVVESTGIVQTIPVPFQPALPESSFSGSVVLAPSRGVAAFPQSDTNVLIADLVNQTCCTSVANPSQNPLQVLLGGAFSPDSTQFAIGFVDQEFGGGVTVIDAATGNVISTMPGQAFDATTAIVSDWTDEGIQFVPTCWACEGTIEGRYGIWNPTANNLETNAGDYFNFLYGADVLEGTGEVIVGAYDPGFESLGEPGMFPASNVVQFYLNAESASSATNPQTIYQWLSPVNVPAPRWVVDGEAFVVQSDAVFDMLFRDGTPIETPALESQQFLAGTRDGWLTYDPVLGELAEYTYGNGAVASSVILNNLSGDLIVVETPALGFGRPAQPFSYSLQGTIVGDGITEPIAQPTAPTSDGGTVCPGFIASRLAIGEPAAITPGPANNLRAQPTLSGDLIGAIPGAAPVTVLGGPVCADNMAWWQVQYNNQVGWTSEGTGNTYWMEPQ